MLEVTGTLIVDDRANFNKMRLWTPADVSRQVTAMLAAVAPEPAKVTEFENIIEELFPA